MVKTSTNSACKISAILARLASNTDHGTELTYKKHSVAPKNISEVPTQSKVTNAEQKRDEIRRASNSDGRRRNDSRSNLGRRKSSDGQNQEARTRKSLKHRAILTLALNDDCGIGPDGFEPGNTCAKKGIKCTGSVFLDHVLVTKACSEWIVKTLGKGKTIQDVAMALGVPDTANVKRIKYSGDNINSSYATDYIAIDYEDKSLGILDASRLLGVNHTGEKKGKPYIENEYLALDPDKRGKGLGAELLFTQVENAKKYGISHIQTMAARSDEMNGYIVWPKLGYEGSVFVPNSTKKRLGIKFDPDKDDHVLMSELMSTPEGQKYWKENGGSFDATFDLSDDSKSLKILRKYMAAKKAKPTPTTNVFCATGKGGGVDPSCSPKSGETHSVHKEIIDAVNSIPMYRGSRDGSTGKVTKVPAYFISEEIFAKTYGPTTSHSLLIKNPKIVTQDEWMEFDTTLGQPKALKKLAKDGYDAAISVREIRGGRKMYVVVVVSEHAIDRQTNNVFCATGKLGGIDPTCKKGESKSVVCTGNVDLSGVKRSITRDRWIEHALGKGKTLKDVALAMGVPDTAEIEEVYFSAASPPENRIEESFILLRYKDAYLGIKEAHRDLSFDIYGKLMLQNSLLVMEEGNTGTGLGTELFHTEVENAKKAGIGRIITYAARKPYMNGYYTWARLGYDAKVSLRKEIKEELKLETKDPDAFVSLLDIVSTPEGQKYWKEHGESFHGQFDLSDDSRSLRILRNYVKAKKKAKVTTNAKSCLFGQIDPPKLPLKCCEAIPRLESRTVRQNSVRGPSERATETLERLDLNKSGLSEVEYGSIENIFCATGKKGGVDPTCGKGSVKRKNPAAKMIRKLKLAGGLTYLTLPGAFHKESGYSVSPYPEISEVFENKIKREDIKNFMTKNKELLNKPDHALGIFKDASDGKIFLDVSIITKSKKDAEKLGRKYNQRSYYDFARNEVVDTGGTGEPGNNCLYVFIANRRTDRRFGRVAQQALTIENEFCATGKGGGIDPTCSPKGSNHDTGKEDGAGNDGAIIGKGRTGSDGRRVYPGTLREVPSKEYVTRIARSYIKEHGEKLGLKNLVEKEPEALDTAKSKHIGELYESMPLTTLDNPETLEAYKQLAKETLMQYKAMIDHGMTVDYMEDDPYPSSKDMMDDVANNKHLRVFLTSKDSFGSKEVTHNHPLLAETGLYHKGKPLLFNDVFRSVHDFFGHAMQGNEFGPVGEERAWAKHSMMFSETARKAMSFETRGQNSWVNFGPHMYDKDGWKGDKKHPRYISPGKRPYAEQKVGVLPKELVHNRYIATINSLSGEIDKAANLTDLNTTEEQRKAGNYRKGKVRLHGLEISIESPKWSIRRGVAANGKPWSVEMKSHYGYIKQTESEADGDHIDVFLGPYPESEIVFIVDQTKAPQHTVFDEHKVLIGWLSEKEAKTAYLENYSEGWKGFDSIVSMTIDQFKEWLFNGDTSIPVNNVFCPTGEGNGVDPTCSPKGGSTIKESRPSRKNESFDDELTFETKGGSIGFAKSKYAPTDWSVTHTFVEEDQRRQGIASRLIEHAKANLKGTLGAQASNDGSVKLFWKHGFRLEGGTLEDALAQRKEWSSVNLIYDPKLTLNNCGIGPHGFERGNTCAMGSDGGGMGGGGGSTKGMKKVPNTALTDIVNGKKLKDVPSKSKTPSVKEGIAYLGTKLGNNIDLANKGITDAEIDIVALGMANDVINANYKSNVDSGWYTRDIQKAISLMSEPPLNHKELEEGDVDPKNPSIIRTSKNHKFAFSVCLALTSPNTDVLSNGRDAEFLYNHWKKTGEFYAENGFSSSQSKLPNQLKLIQSLVKKRGLDGAETLLLDTYLVSDVNKKDHIPAFQGSKIKGVAADTDNVPGFAIFGSKLGAFFANIMGEPEHTTIDLWETRHLNIIAGQPLKVPSSASLRKQATDLTELISSGKVTNFFGIDKNEILKGAQQVIETGIELPLKSPYAQWAKEQQKIYAKRSGYDEAKQKEVTRYANKTDVDHVANAIHVRGRTTDKKAPNTVGEKTTINEVYKRALVTAKQHFPDMTAAEFQAISWSFTQRLLKQTGARVEIDQVDEDGTIIEKNFSNSIQRLINGKSVRRTSWDQEFKVVKPKKVPKSKGPAKPKKAKK